MRLPALVAVVKAKEDCTSDVQRFQRVIALLTELQESSFFAREETTMQKVLIDKFVVPEESKAALLEAARSSASFLRTLPGFVEGFFYEKTEGDSLYNIVTTAVWESEEAFLNAKKAAAEEFQKRGFNPQKIMKELNVEIDRAVYHREPY